MISDYGDRSRVKPSIVPLIGVVEARVSIKSLKLKQEQNRQKSLAQSKNNLEAQKRHR